MNSINPMALLLKYEGYPSAILLAMLLHGALLYFIIGSDSLAIDFMDVEQPVYISATAVDVNPQRLRRLEQVRLEQQKAAQLDRQKAEQRAEQTRQNALVAEAAERAKAIEVAQQEADARAAKLKQEQEVAEKLRQENQERARAAELARIEEERRVQQQQVEQQRAEQQRIREEAQRQAAAQAAADQNSVQTYMGIVRDAVARNWLVPPSARNGMIVELELRIVPTGEVIAYDIIQASGDDAFDRSALQAVGRVNGFPELQSMQNSLFEQNFRILKLRFRPEDLLR